MFIKPPFLIFLIGFLLILPFSWFGSNEVLLGGEAYTAIDYRLLVSRNLFFWNGSYGLGLPNISIIPQLYHFFLFIISPVISVSFSHKLILGLILSLSFFSSFIFLRYIYGKNNDWATVLGALFYVFNPFLVSMFGWVPTYGFLFIFTPLILLQTMKIFEGKGSSLNYSLLFIFGFCYGGVGMNLALYSFAYWFIFFLALRQYFILRNFFAVTRRFLVAIFIMLLSNLYWILPFSQVYKNIYGGASVYSFNFSDISLYRLPIFNSFTLNEYYWFTRKTLEGDYFYPFSVWYEQPSQLVVLFLLVFVFMAVVITKKKLQIPYFLFFTILLISGLFLTKGTADPLGEIYRYLLKFVKFFGIYRSSDIKFPFFVIVSFAYLIPYALISFKNVHFFKKKIAYIYMLIFIGIIFLGAPFITGGVLPERQATINSLKVTVPQYWEDAMKHIENDKSGRVALFPRNYSPLDNYKWGYKGVFLPYHFVDNPVIGYTIGYGSSVEESRFKITNILYSLYEKNQMNAMMRFSSLLNIKYFLMREDFDLKQNAYDVGQTYDGVYNSETVSERFTGNLVFDSKIGNLTFYTLPKEFFLEKFYAPKKIILLTNDNLVEIENAIVSEEDSGSIALLYDTENQIQKTHSGTIINYSKNSPTEYSITVLTDSEVVPIVFSETYSEGWEIRIDNISDKLESEVNKSHLLANGYSNFWNLDIKNICNESGCLKTKDGITKTTFKVVYAPDSQFRLGSLITIGGLVVSLVIIGRMTMLRLRLKKNEK